MALPKRLVDFNVSIDGIGYLHRCNYIEIPKLKKKFEEVQYSGLQVPKKEFIGYEPLVTKISFPEHVEIAYAMFGLNAKVAQITARGAFKEQGGIAESCVAIIAGTFEEIDPGQWKTGANNEFIVTVDTQIFSLTKGARPLINIDVDNGIFTFGGIVDSNLDVKRAMGVI